MAAPCSSVEDAVLSRDDLPRPPRRLVLAQDPILLLEDDRANNDDCCCVVVGVGGGERLRDFRLLELVSSPVFSVTLSFPADLDDLGRFELLFVELAGAVVESAVDEFLLLELCC